MIAVIRKTSRSRQDHSHVMGKLWKELYRGIQIMMCEPNSFLPRGHFLVLVRSERVTYWYSYKILQHQDSLFYSWSYILLVLPVIHDHRRGDHFTLTGNNPGKFELSGYSSTREYWSVDIDTIDIVPVIGTSGTMVLSILYIDGTFVDHDLLSILEHDVITPLIL